MDSHRPSVPCLIHGPNAPSLPLHLEKKRISLSTLLPFHFIIFLWWRRHKRKGMFNILWITHLLSDRCILRSLPTKLHWNSKFYSSMNLIPLSMYVSCLPKALFASIILPLLDINPSIFGEGFIPKNGKVF